MIAPQRIVTVTLAAGLSQRFGGDKLAARFGKASVLEGSLAALAGRQWLASLVVASPDRPVPAMFERVANDKPEAGQAHSLALGIEAARRRSPDALLVTLGDMPRITPADIALLLAGEGAKAARYENDRPGPPALIPAWLLPELLQRLSGDRGAQAFLADHARLVDLPSDHLRDVDVPGDL